MHRSIVALEDEGTMFKPVMLKECINNEVLNNFFVPTFLNRVLVLVTVPYCGGDVHVRSPHNTTK